jgi:hypothetical protein
MARTPTDNSEIQAAPVETLAEMLYYLVDPDKRRELEEFRIRFEAVHGPTDLTRRYTSTWPEDQQAWLLNNDPKRWFDGLPSFVKAHVRGKLEAAARKGNLDDAPDELLGLFVAKQLKLDHEARTR